MPVLNEASGTQAAAVGTEHFLASVNKYGVYVFEVDCAALAEGEVVELRAYRKILSTGVSRPTVLLTVVGPETQTPVVRVDPVSNEHDDAQALRFSLKQTAGSPRSFDWKVLRHI